MVGWVKSVVPHPNADRLRLCEVDTGAAIYRVVCGASNVAAGQKIVFAEIGATIGIRISARLAASVTSEGPYSTMSSSGNSCLRMFVIFV